MFILWNRLSSCHLICIRIEYIKDSFSLTSSFSESSFPHTAIKISTKKGCLLISSQSLSQSKFFRLSKSLSYKTDGLTFLLQSFWHDWFSCFDILSVLLVTLSNNNVLEIVGEFLRFTIGFSDDGDKRIPLFVQVIFLKLLSCSCASLMKIHTL